MQQSLLILAFALVAFTAGCGADETTTTSRGVDDSTAPTLPPEQRFEATGTILESPEHGPQLCAGGVAESWPPQCSGPDVLGWDWSDVEGEESSSGTTWGSFHLVGTWDGAALTLSEPPRPPEQDVGAPTAEELEARFDSPCPEPPGGWRVVDPDTTTDAAMRAAGAYALAKPDVGGTWIDQVVEGPDGTQVNAVNDPSLLIYNVSFTGDLEQHEIALREIWGGKLCVSEAPRSAADLAEVRREVEAELGIDQMTFSATDEVTGRVEIGVLVDDGLQEQLDERFGEGVVRVHGTLRPVDR